MLDGDHASPRAQVLLSPTDLPSCMLIIALYNKELYTALCPVQSTHSATVCVCDTCGETSATYTICKVRFILSVKIIQYI